MEEVKCFKRFIICFLAGFLGLAVLVGGFVALVDPYYHYHKPCLGIPVILEDAVYQTAGAAKHLEYDSAIIGTSMTENMHTSWFDDALGWNTMKLSYSGARTNDLQAIFAQVEQKEGELKHVVMDINTYQLTEESWTSYVERPHYLYDDSWWNDYQYLYNHDVLTLSVKSCIARAKGISDNIDTAYTWEEPELFGKEITLNSARSTRARLIGDRPIDENLYVVSGTTTENLERKLQVCQENLDNILPFIEAHPETEFWVMIPPYSMLYWEELVLQGTLEDMLAIYTYAIEHLMCYDNVKVYYFQNEFDVITDLDNYRDSAHHTPEYNRYMFECMRDGKNLLTQENYREELESMYDFAKDYPYNTLWDE